jgi:hypothetical protein
MHLYRTNLTYSNHFCFLCSRVPGRPGTSKRVPRIFHSALAEVLRLFHSALAEVLRLFHSALAEVLRLFHSALAEVLPCLGREVRVPRPGLRIPGCGITPARQGRSGRNPTPGVARVEGGIIRLAHPGPSIPPMEGVFPRQVHEKLTNQTPHIRTRTIPPIRASPPSIWSASNSASK